ncbi:DUF3617 domain-containing protein [Noviherbaspirillum autotrophicum]|nr:DUF3617 domain-containing protein [Noviherbaspirillum autotrophicum]
MRIVARSILLLSLLSSSAAVLAAGQTKAGLWEMTMKSDAMKNMPKIAPEQMEQMRKMGINVPQMQDGGLVTKVCISQEMAERDEPPPMEDKASGCQTRNFQRNGSSYSMDIVCDGPQMKGTGRARGTFSGNTSFTSTYDFKGAMHGQPVSQHHETSGKWLSADCGSIKPIGDLMPKK